MQRFQRKEKNFVPFLHSSLWRARVWMPREAERKRTIAKLPCSLACRQLRRGDTQMKVGKKCVVLEKICHSQSPRLPLNTSMNVFHYIFGIVYCMMMDVSFMLRKSHRGTNTYRIKKTTTKLSLPSVLLQIITRKMGTYKKSVEPRNEMWRNMKGFSGLGRNMHRFQLQSKRSVKFTRNVS